MASSRRTWGWYELDRRWARRLVEEAGLPLGAWVLDVGAGTGALTGPLVDAGVKVIAVERHRGRADELRRRFGSSVIVVGADAGDLRLPRRPFHVVANPPFAITSVLLHRLLQPGSRLLSATVVVQDQAGRRWTDADAPGARRWARHFDVSLGRSIPATAFRPMPHVPVRVLRIEHREAPCHHGTAR